MTSIASLSPNMADTKNTNMDSSKSKASPNAHRRRAEEDSQRKDQHKDKKDGPESCTTAQYCEKLQAWMCQYSTGYVTWQSWLAASAAMSHPSALQSHNGTSTPRLESNGQYFGAAFSPNAPASGSQSSRQGDAAAAAAPAPGGAAVPTRPQQLPQENGNARRPGREYTIPSPLQRLLAEIVDFFILFFIKATIIISIMHLSGIKDVSKFAMHFIVDEIDEETSMEELQKMMLVALVYPIFVCFYEIVCIWGAGGATPGKFLIGLRVVTCDSSVLVQPNRVLVVPATDVSLSASTVRALSKNFSIAFFFPAFVTLLFFQHNRTVYDMVAGTIVVKRSRVR
ncbi:protein FAM8A1-like [Syngnathoides biaculeatus]|uniref:protein FAM8A1-like n=1 Tax=Syngnathoides biaculeatus TaxID=300417 RepID=UPI002ADE161B|nr:protein FAM8A1-like [Syngnathoides biaculeatus]XP_061677258.1 protein FAM8A1-like [Syngnathoides biaculeatus]XP_061677259.1 protein FAM8A1-like [Syngnathoides biaculeatus]